jgi:hypothetical protein
MSAFRAEKSRNRSVKCWRLSSEFPVKKLADVEPVMFGPSDDLVSPFSFSPSKAFSFQADLSPIGFGGSSPSLDSPMTGSDPSFFGSDIPAFADILSAFESARQEQLLLQPFVSFEATEQAVSRLRNSRK